VRLEGGALARGVFGGKEPASNIAQSSSGGAGRHRLARRTSLSSRYLYVRGFGGSVFVLPLPSMLLSA
jgi:hypothetical protein